MITDLGRFNLVKAIDNTDSKIFHNGYVQVTKADHSTGSIFN